MIGLSMMLLSVLMAGVFLGGVRWVAPESTLRAALGVVALMGGTGTLAAAGALTFDTVPPTMPLLLVVLVAGTVAVARSGLGAALATRVPLAVLVGYQGFRIPVELWLHRGYVEGLFPVQMTYSGLNFDILSGISGVVVGALVWRGLAGRRLVLVWNVFGLGLLLSIVTIALLSAPTPFRVFTDGPSAEYVMGFPGVWLPAVLVQLALLGHLVVFRRLIGQVKA